MPRKPLDKPEPRLRPRGGVWYIYWTEPGIKGSRGQSTGVPVRAGRTKPEQAPPEAWRALDLWIEARDSAHEEITVAELLDIRLQDLRSRLDPHDLPADAPKTHRPSHRFENAHRLVKKELGHVRAHDLGKAQLTRYGRKHQWRRKVSYAFTEIRAAYRLVGLDPPEFPRVPGRAPRDEFIPHAKAWEMIESAEVLHMKVFLLLAFLSGQRKGSILDLTWERVNLETGVVDFNDPRRPLTDKRRAIVHLDKRGLAILRQAHDQRRSAYVVEWKEGRVRDVKTGFAAACVRCGLYREDPERKDEDGEPLKIPLYTPHHTKHSVISWLAEDGWDIDRIADYTNTNRETVRRVYRKVNPGALTGLSRSLGDRLFGAGRAALKRVK